jgi:hypothetical protein
MTADILTKAVPGDAHSDMYEEWDCRVNKEDWED